jgi:membrane protein DedA with SNARE-associated domain
MPSLEAFLDAYGLAAIFVLMLIKSAGAPIPIPADVVMLAVSARVSEGRFMLGPSFIILLAALVLGGIVQFLLARGPGRSALYRFGRYLGLTAARLDAAAARIKRGGPLAIGVAILTPGVRAAAVAACGLARLPLRAFAPGLLLGSGLFLALHFFLGAIIAQVLAALSSAAPLPALVIGLLLLIVAGIGVWYIIRRRQRPAASRGEVFAEALEAWHEATCPVCLALGATSRLSAVTLVEASHA